MILKLRNTSQTELDKIHQLQNYDWELQKAETRYLTHNYHPYSSKFIPQIPNYLISAFTKKNDLILDNFLGSGTTLVEAKILGRNGIGIDINPLACLISKVKTTKLNNSKLRLIKDIVELMSIDIARLRGSNTILDYSDISLSIDILNINKLHPNILKWFYENVINELLIIQSKIDNVDDIDIKNFLLVAFSSILRYSSKASNDFGNLMIDKNAKPKEKIFERFRNTVNNMINSMIEFNKVATDSNIEIINSDTRYLDFIKNESIDFICTHPPYMAAVPYAEYQKLSLWWLHFKQYDLEKKLIGGQRRLVDTPKRYYSDVKVVLKEMKRVLKRKRYCCIVIGNPIYNGKIWELNQMIKDEATELKFTCMLEITRGKYKATMGKMKKEFILVFKNE